MSTLSITSPGVQINEVDLSVISRPIGATDVLITGFAPQGPTEEFTNITSISEYEQVFGTPTNGAERYLYHSARQILNTSPANLLVNRLPYGDGLGSGYANSYSVLVYPISTDATTFSAASSYSLLEPTSVLLSEDEYNSLTKNDLKWATSPFALSSINVGTSSVNVGNPQSLDSFYTSNPLVNSATDISAITPLTLSLSTVSFYTRNQTTSAYNIPQITGYNSLTAAGLIVVNESKTSINDIYEGYYVGITDNLNINPSTNYNAVTGVKTVTSNNGNSQNLSVVPTSRFNFALSATSDSFGKSSISQILETYPTGYDFSSNSFNDSLIVVLFKIRSSTYNQDTVTLDYTISEGYAGSLYANRTQNNPNGGTPTTFFLDNVVDKKSNNLKIVTNPYISQVGAWTDSNGLPTKSVRISDSAKNLYASGVYLSDTDTNSKVVGNVPLKLKRILNQLQNTDTINIDVVAEAGLGTIWASAKALSETGKAAIYDENFNVDLGNITNTSTTTSLTGAGSYYSDIASQFVSLATDSRKDHVFIADPLRHIFVQGANGKVSDSKDFVFSDDIYWPVKNLIGSLGQSSYTTVYGNWIKYRDVFSDTDVWLPASGYVAANIASTSQNAYPWTPVAGFNHGAISNVKDLAINPTQKQRDLLYKININPIAFFPNDGFVIYGQKTLYSKPSAFDRLNVRRLFLTLEKSTQALLKYFVFEPNTFSTQQRLVGSLTPLFDKAKIGQGLYDYTIVCDNRNNTPSVIDNNELRVAIYIQPVRAAEFILCDFIATQTGVDFNELIGQGQL